MFSAEKEKTSIDLDALRVEVDRLKVESAFTAKYGSHLTGEQREFYRTEEAEQLRIKEGRANTAKNEANRKNELDLDKKYRDLACELVRKGSLLISVDGQRIKTLTPDLLILCPRCGKPVYDLQARVYDIARAWYWATVPGTVQDLDATFTIYSARSPLTEQGVAGYSLPVCLYCREHIRGTIQVILI